MAETGGEYLPETLGQKFRRILAGKPAPRKPVGSEILDQVTEPKRAGTEAVALQQQGVNVKAPAPTGHVVAGSGTEPSGRE